MLTALFEILKRCCSDWKCNELVVNMRENNPNKLDIKKRISKYRKRLDEIKNQGYHFSHEIYDDLDALEKKIKQPSLIQQALNKKSKIVIGILIMGSLIIAGFYSPFIFGLFIIPPEPTIEITINNLDENDIISQDYIIRGTTHHSNNESVSTQVKIDDGGWNQAIGTSFWEYPLNISNLSNDKHTLSFYCSDNDGHSITKTISFTIEKVIPSPPKPVVSIEYPSNNDIITESINISGSAEAGYGKILRVEIRFNDGDWIVVNGTLNWFYSWDISNLEDGFVRISVKCYDNNTSSDIETITVVIQKEPDEFIYDMPTGGLFDLYLIYPIEPMKPNKSYEIQGKHRKKYDNTISATIVQTILSVNRKPDWLSVSIPEDTLITPPDGSIYNFSIYMNISDDAPRERITHFTITYMYGTNWAMNQYKNGLLQNFLMAFDRITIGQYDIQITTGQW